MPAEDGPGMSRQLAAQWCSECSASYSGSDDSCGARFHALLALDHSRQEPWGSRHGQAFAAFALQHPETYPASLAGPWQALYRIYHLREPAERVFAIMRLPRSRQSGPIVAIGGVPDVPPRPAQRSAAPTIT